MMDSLVSSILNSLRVYSQWATAVTNDLMLKELEWWATLFVYSFYQNATMIIP